MAKKDSGIICVRVLILISRTNLGSRALCESLVRLGKRFADTTLRIFEKLLLCTFRRQGISPSRMTEKSKYSRI